MSQVCRQCSRVNPAEAAYCYYDGAVLAGHAGSGPINAGSAPFPNQFVFPTGQICKNFDQLALACQQNWTTALDMLRQGFLGTFFGGLGRADLAMAALEATKFPDADRGLDQLLGKLPTNVLQNARLQAEPREINLGQVPLGADRSTEIQLANLGMRLLYGSVSSDCKWLTLGEAPGSPQKVFQFGAETVIPVHVKGQHLRAGTKPLEGNLIVESNGGTATVTLRADVPINPYQGGLFDGALTPRQVAEKAKANPKEAAPYFESGAVAQWFESNGWIYPVQGPSASGMGGVQQFFEALGLAKPPKIEINTQSLSFSGGGGESLQATIEVNAVATPDKKKKPVYAYATCDQPWVDCSKVKLAGATAIITIAIPRVPNRPGETLQAKVRIVGNGNQKFTVPMLLTIGAPDPNPPPEPQPAPPALPEAAPPPPAPIEAPLILGQAEAPFADLEMPAAPAPIFATGSEPVGVAPSAREAPRGSGKPLWLHLTPLALLLVALVGVLFYDWLSPAPANVSGDQIDPNPRIGLLFDWANQKQKGIDNTMSFGLSTINPATRKADKKLTYGPRGETNSTVLLIDGKERVFGKLDHGNFEDRPASIDKHGGLTATFKFSEKQIWVTQRVKIVAGETVEVAPDVYKRLLDTCLVRYTIRNRDDKAHKVGVRILLDTYIGDNDGCPFTIPGSDKIVSTFDDFNPSDAKNKKPIPDFIQALEFEDLRNPGTIAQVNFRLDDIFEPPSRVSLTQWPGRAFLPKYLIPINAIDRDSSVVIYWQTVDMEPGRTRELGFTYGLGDVVAQGEGKIGLTIGGSLSVRGELSVVALVAEAEKGQKATLEFPPEGFTLVSSTASQAVPVATEKNAEGRLRASPVTWRLRALRDGSFPITVRTSNGLEATRRIAIKKSSVF